MTKAWKRVGGAVGVAGALIVGGIIAGTVSASADEGSTASTGSSTSRPVGDGERGPRGEELTGDTASQVEAAVLAAYPGAELVHSMAGPDGGYAAAITTAEDARLLVLLDDSFTVTDTLSPPAGRGGPGGGQPEDD